VNKIVLMCGVVSVLGVLLLTDIMWVGVIRATNEDPLDLQAAEPSPVTPAPPPTPQEDQEGPQAKARQDVEADAKLRKRFKEGLEKSRQKQEAREQNAQNNAASQNKVNRGETVTLPSELAVTVYSYTSPIQSNNEFLKPQAGKKFTAIDVEGWRGAPWGTSGHHSTRSISRFRCPTTRA
jgi:hypothetical protein